MTIETKLKISKISLWALFLVFIIIAIVSFGEACLTKGTTLKFAIFFSSSILACEAWIVLRLFKRKKGGEEECQR